jgi:hypothetical protein
MLRFVWHPHGFQIVDAMLNGEMFTTACHMRNILIEIVARRGVERGEMTLVVHTENAMPHRASLAALLQIESLQNEVNNRLLSDSSECSNLEMLIPSWDILDIPFLTNCWTS